MIIMIIIIIMFQHFRVYHHHVSSYSSSSATAASAASCFIIPLTLSVCQSVSWVFKEEWHFVLLLEKFDFSWPVSLDITPHWLYKINDGFGPALPQCAFNQTFDHGLVPVCVKSCAPHEGNQLQKLVSNGYLDGSKDHPMWALPTECWTVRKDRPPEYQGDRFWRN